MKKIERRNSSEGVVIQRGASQLPAGLRYKRVEGALSKKSRDRQKIARRLSNDSGWRVRFFVLENDALLYYASEQVRLQPQPPVRGHMSLQGLTLTRSLDERELRALQPPRAFAQFVIKLAPQDEAQGGRPLYLHATNEREYLKWCDALQHNIYLTNNPRGGRFAATGFAGVDEDSAAVATEMSAPGNMRPNRQRAMTTGSAPLPGLDVELSPERAGTAPPNSQPLPSRVGPSAAAAAAAGDVFADDDGGAARVSMSEGGAPSRLGRDVSLPLMSGSEWGAKRGAFPPPPPPGLKTRQRAESAAALARGPSSCGSAIDGGAGGSAPSLGVGGGSSGELRPPPMGARMGSFERNQGNVGRARSATTATCGARDGSAPDVVKCSAARERRARGWTPQHRESRASRKSRGEVVSSSSEEEGDVLPAEEAAWIARRQESGPLGSPRTRSADEIAPPPPPPAAKRAHSVQGRHPGDYKGPMAQPLADGTPVVQGWHPGLGLPSSPTAARARAQSASASLPAGLAGAPVRKNSVLDRVRLFQGQASGDSIPEEGDCSARASAAEGDDAALEAFLEKVQLAHDSAEADSPGTPRDGPPMRPARLHSMTL